MKTAKPPAGPGGRLQIRRAQLFPEHVEREFDDEEQDSSAGREPEHLGQEARVEGAEAFLARDEGERREGPVVFRSLAGNLSGVARRWRAEVRAGFCWCKE